MWRFPDEVGTDSSSIYRLIRWGQRYVNDGAAAYERRYQEARVRRIAATAKQLGLYVSLTQPVSYFHQRSQTR
jgi:hypothetical protein